MFLFAEAGVYLGGGKKFLRGGTGIYIARCEPAELGFAH